jgi:hypothetical protein
MILKLLRDGCGDLKFELIDDVASVTFGRDEENDTETNPARNPRATAYTHYRDGRVQTFNINHIAYVLNDQGKTIDSFSRTLSPCSGNPLGETAGERRLRIKTAAAKS